MVEIGLDWTATSNVIIIESIGVATAEWNILSIENNTRKRRNEKTKLKLCSVLSWSSSLLRKKIEKQKQEKVHFVTILSN